MKPILFSGPMVRASMREVDPKTVTRRVVNKLIGFGQITEFGPSTTPGYVWTFRDKRMLWNDISHARLLKACPYGQPGDALWVRETFCKPDPLGGYVYRADLSPVADALERRIFRQNPSIAKAYPESRWRPSIHMPRAAARLFLRVTSVRVERLQEISCADAIAEGCTPVSLHALDCASPDPRDEYRALWDSLNASRGYPWESNPFVWRIAFERIKEPK